MADVMTTGIGRTRHSTAALPSPANLKSKRLLAVLASIVFCQSCGWLFKEYVAFAGSRLLVTGRRGNSELPRANMMQEFAQGMSDSAMASASGLSKEENDELVERCQSGEMDFNDFVKALKVFQGIGDAASGAKGVMDKMTGQDNSEEDEEAKAKLEEKEYIISVMTPEQRKKPEIFFEGGPPTRKAIANLAQAASRSEHEIQEFIMEFRALRSTLVKLVKHGTDYEEVVAEVKKEAEEWKMATKSRTARRQAKMKAGRKQKGQPEWMTL